MPSSAWPRLEFNIRQISLPLQPQIPFSNYFQLNQFVADFFSWKTQILAEINYNQNWNKAQESNQSNSFLVK